MRWRHQSCTGIMNSLCPQRLAAACSLLWREGGCRARDGSILKLLDQLLQTLDCVRPGMVTCLHSAPMLLQGKRTQAVGGVPVQVSGLASLGGEGAVHVIVPCQWGCTGRMLQVCCAGLGVRLSHSEPPSCAWAPLRWLDPLPAPHSGQ